jgi:hypothetical protein
MAQYKSAHRLDGSLFIGRMVTACSPIAEGGATKCTLALINQPSDYFLGVSSFWLTMQRYNEFWSIPNFCMTKCGLLTIIIL